MPSLPLVRISGVPHGVFRAAALILSISLFGAGAASAQDIDCGRLRAQIAQADRGGGRSGGAGRRQAVELARAEGAAQQLGCSGGGFASLFGGGDPRCAGIMQRIQQLQAYVAQTQGGGGGGRADLVARFNAYCRGGQPQQAQQPQQRGFFESLFGGPQEEPRPAPLPDMAPRDGGQGQDDDGESHARGGSQAVCVRTCDGGFFPLGVSARRAGDDLKEMCQALCPGTETAVYTRNPNSEIDTSVALDGKPYADLPNAMKFSKAFVPECSCRPKDKSWAQALANAEEVIGNTRKGDIVVTQAKSDELSRPKMDAKARASMLAGPAPAPVDASAAAKIAGDAADNEAGSPPETAMTDGTARGVRKVGPQQ